MMPKIIQISLLLLVIKCTLAHLDLELDVRNPALDPQIYEDALDPELCQEQLSYIRRLNNTLLRLQFLESGMRFPRGFLQGNTLDMGNYFQCIGIEHEMEDSVIEGKYCRIRGPINENFEAFAKTMDWKDFDADLHLSDETMNKYEEYNEARSKWLAGAILDNDDDSERNIPGNPLAGTRFTLAVCVPKTCTSEEGMRGLILSLNLLGIQFEEQFCRFKNDKPWVAGDYVGITIFSLIGLLSVLSTSYDVWHQIIAKKAPKTASTLYRSFSVYTNARRLTTFTSGATTLECVDGVRALAMMWVVVGHTYSTLPAMVNNFDVFVWLFDFSSLWITAAPYTVDTFFLLSGILVVYTTAGKMSGMKLLKNLHWFYLNRLLRMFPLLAAVIVLQIGILNRAADGPNWSLVVRNTNRCRSFWWSTLLYVQNFVNAHNMCINHSWYLAIDMHCYILSPLVLFWVLNGKKNYAWIALTAGILASIIAATTYTVIYQFPGWMIAPDRGGPAYLFYYYFNTITRASPFFVGMIFGYLLHIWKGRKPDIPIILALVLWVCAIAMTSLCMYVTYLMKELETWDYPVVDDLVNSLARPMWAMAVGWIIFACQYGYGGPINWFLSLHFWKLPSRISYGMYLFHYPIMYVVSATTLQPIFWSDASTLFLFLGHMALAFIVSFIMTLLIDSPFSILFKFILGDGPKKPKKQVEDKE